MTIVNPIQSTTYNLLTASNPYEFGSSTNISTTANTTPCISGGAGTNWNVTIDSGATIQSQGALSTAIALGSSTDSITFTNNASVTSQDYNGLVVGGALSATINANISGVAYGINAGANSSIIVASTATVTGSETISGGVGIDIQNTSSITNHGTITGTDNAIQAAGPDITITNSGTISNTGRSTAIGINVIKDNASITNNSGASISGQAIGISLQSNSHYSASVVDNSGSISGNISIQCNGTGQHQLIFRTQASVPTSPIDKFASGASDYIDLPFMTYSAASLTWTQSGSNGTLAVTDGTHTADIALNGTYTQSHFALANDGSGGTKVTYS